MTFKREITYQMKSTGNIKDLIVTYVFLPPDLIMVHTEDITENKKKDGILKKLSNAVEQTADTVVITDNKGIIEYVNPAFEKTTGFSREQVVGQSPKLLKSGKHDITFYQQLWKILLSGNPFRDTIINKKKNGELYWCEQTITPMKDEKGNITNFVAVMKDITKLKEQQEQEFRLKLAHEIQKRLYKPNICVSGFDIAGDMISADQTSGDYYDFVWLADGSIGLVVGDVCGHGIGSAMIMERTRAYLRAFTKYESDPSAILRLLNNELVTDLDDLHYATLLFVRLDTKLNLLEYASAGHISGYVLNSFGKVEYILESTGIPLGYILNADYKRSEKYKLTPNNIVILLSDGITEAQNVEEVEFGCERVLDIIHRNQNATSKCVLEQLFQEVHTFTQNQPQQDDSTAIICKVNEPGK